MSQYPVLTPQGIKEGVNYLLSGPAGLGQNFDGFSSSNTVYLLDSNVAPYVSTVYTTYANYDTANTFTVVDSSNIVANMVATSVGILPNTTVSNVSGNIVTISTNMYAFLSNTSVQFTQPANIANATVQVNPNPTYISTDCVSNALSTNATDRIFLSGQLNYTVYMSWNGSDNICGTTSAINRYKLVPVISNTQTYQYHFDSTIASNFHVYNVNSGNTTFTFNDVYASEVDKPGIGYSEYRLELAFNTYEQVFSPPPPYVNQCVLTVRSLTSQVVKQ